MDVKSLPPNDSEDVWRVVARNKRARRKEIVLNLDTDPERGLRSAAIRKGDLKLVWGQHKLLKQKVTISLSLTPLISPVFTDA